MDEIIWDDVPEGEALTRLAEEKLAAGQLDDAITYQSRGVRLRRQLFGQRSPHLAVALGALARMVQKKSGLAATRPYYEESLAVLETVYGPDHANIAKILGYLIEVARAEGDGPRADELARRKHGIDGTGAPPPPRTAVTAGAMTRQELFELVADEVFRDGVVEAHENEILNKLVHFLKLPSDRAREICRAAQEKFKRGEMGEARALDRTGLYERILVSVCADGEIDGQEAQMLAGMRRLLAIEEPLHERLLAKVRAG